MAEDKEFYVGQKAFIKKDNKLLVLFDPILGFDFPGGKIQEGENDYEKSLKREVTEETGLDIKIGKPFYTWSFKIQKKHRNQGKEVFLVAYLCTYISGEVNLSDEHNKFNWYSKKDYQELKEDSGFYQALEKYFQIT